MTNQTQPRIRASEAFTLVELLIVIAIIAVLAALIFPAAAAIKKSGILRKARTELQQIDTAIEGYKEKLGHYPSDNPLTSSLPNPAPPAPSTNYGLNQLYYELLGTEAYTENSVNYFRTLDGSAKIKASASEVRTAFGHPPDPNGPDGFVNYTRDKSGDSSNARAFLRGLKPGQYAEGTVGGVTVRILTSSITWPYNFGSQIPLFTPSDPVTTPNPWRYNSSNPVHNPNSFDLWIDVYVGGKTNRISNWSEQPQVVGSFAYP